MTFFANLLRVQMHKGSDKEVEIGADKGAQSNVFKSLLWKIRNWKKCSTLAIFGLGLSSAIGADTLNIAVASNFASVMPSIVKGFEAQTSHKVRVSYGSSGKIYAQIRHGAPFDVFLSADQDKPNRLIAESLAVRDSQFTYAQGQLALFAPRLTDESHTPKQIVMNQKFNKLAIANPKLAPYGAAAEQVIRALVKNGSLTEQIQTKLVTGENINQTYQYVVSGNAELGFVALSQVTKQPSNRVWKIPTSLYDPIKQDAVIVESSRHLDAAKQFTDYLKAPSVKEVIEAHGYLSP
ncbi:molybdate ABC transporter substrate-binding protein [Marinomonas mediterranea]|uniref:molybdate ABC transporter substrate-binding protein n=1 Tax=Marinomonas mediterranea TaxID=119864 RepID=UPI00234BBB35|nr:molybdate ABC transporter substrate-binding protein [Marinomonas mediterranea]